MTIGGALSELGNLLKADDIPFYYKPSIEAVMDTIIMDTITLSSKEETLKRDIKQSAIDIKNYCKNRNTCTGCLFDNDGKCKLTAKTIEFIPEDWMV